MFNNKFLINQNKGFTLIEILIAVGLFLGLSLVATQMIHFSLTNSRFVTLTAVRNQLASSVRKVAMDRNAIVVSLKQKDSNGLRINRVLYDCVCGGAGTECATFNGTNLADLWLFDSSSMAQSTLSGQSSGYYDSNGNSVQESEAAFSVKTTVFAECMPNLAVGSSDPPATCFGQSAEFIRIGYSINRHPAAVNDMRPLNGSIFFNIKQINPSVTDCL